MYHFAVSLNGSTLSHMFPCLISNRFGCERIWNRTRMALESSKTAFSSFTLFFLSYSVINFPVWTIAVPLARWSIQITNHSFRKSFPIRDICYKVPISFPSCCHYPIVYLSSFVSNFRLKKTNHVHSFRGGIYVHYNLTSIVTLFLY